MIIPFMLAIVFGMFLPQVLGGGDKLINDILQSGIYLKLAIILLIGKYIFSLIVLHQELLEVYYFLF